MEISQNNIIEPSHYNQQIFEMEIHFLVREEMMDSKEIIENLFLSSFSPFKRAVSSSKRFEKELTWKK